MTAENPLRLNTPEGMLSFPHLTEKWAGKGAQAQGEPKYSACIVFAPETDLITLKSVIVLAGQTFWPKGKFEELLKLGALRMPLRKDIGTKGYAEGSTFFNARTSTKPGVVGREAGPDGVKPAILTDMELIYPGCKVRLNVTAFGYDNVGKGVTFALNNVQWLGHGERLDSRRPAEDDFDVVEAAPSDLADLL